MSLNEDPKPCAADRHGPLLSRRTVMAGAMLAAGAGVRGANAAGPQGELVWAVHTSLAPRLGDARAVNVTPGKANRGAWASVMTCMSALKQ